MDYCDGGRYYYYCIYIYTCIYIYIPCQNNIKLRYISLNNFLNLFLGDLYSRINTQRGISFTEDQVGFSFALYDNRIILILV